MKKTILRWVAVGMILSLAEGVVAAAEARSRWSGRSWSISRLCILR